VGSLRSLKVHERKTKKSCANTPKDQEDQGKIYSLPKDSLLCKGARGDWGKLRGGKKERMKVSTTLFPQDCSKKKHTPMRRSPRRKGRIEGGILAYSHNCKIGRNYGIKVAMYALGVPTPEKDVPKFVGGNEIYSTIKTKIGIRGKGNKSKSTDKFSLTGGKGRTSEKKGLFFLI